MTSFLSKSMFVVGLLFLIAGLIFGIILLNWIGCIVLGLWLAFNLFWCLVEKIIDKGYE